MQIQIQICICICIYACICICIWQADTRQVTSGKCHGQPGCIAFALAAISFLNSLKACLSEWSFNKVNCIAFTILSFLKHLKNLNCLVAQYAKCKVTFNTALNCMLLMTIQAMGCFIVCGYSVFILSRKEDHPHLLSWWVQQSDGSVECRNLSRSVSQVPQ